MFDFLGSFAYHYCMSTETIQKKKQVTLVTVLREIQAVKSQLDKFLLLIPEESISEYKNSAHIKKAYKEALRANRS